MSALSLRAVVASCVYAGPAAVSSQPLIQACTQRKKKPTA